MQESQDPAGKQKKIMFFDEILLHILAYNQEFLV